MSLFGDVLGAIAPSLISGYFNNKAASSASSAASAASNAEVEAAKLSADLMRELYEKSTARMEPWRQAGLGALSKQMYYAGVPNTGPSTSSGITDEQKQALQRLYANYKNPNGVGTANNPATLGNLYQLLGGDGGGGEGAANNGNPDSAGFSGLSDLFGGIGLGDLGSLNVGKALAAVFGPVGMGTLYGPYSDQSWFGAPVVDPGDVGIGQDTYGGFDSIGGPAGGANSVDSGYGPSMGGWGGLGIGNPGSYGGSNGSGEGLGGGVSDSDGNGIGGLF